MPKTVPGIIPAVNVPRERTPKLKTPGDSNPTLKYDKVDSWLDCATRYLTNFPTLTTEEKAAYGVSPLRGDANIWWRTKETTHPHPTWEEFVKLMEEKWQPLNQSQQARDAIAKIRQTASVHAYSQLFMREKIRIKDMQDLEAIDRYKRRLKMDVRLYVEQTEQLKGTMSFGELMNFAERRDQLTFNTQKEYGNHWDPRSHHPRPKERQDLNAVSWADECCGDEEDERSSEFYEEEEELELNAIEQERGRMESSRGPGKILQEHRPAGRWWRKPHEDLGRRKEILHREELVLHLQRT